MWKDPARARSLVRAFVASAIMGLALAVAGWVGAFTGASAGSDQPVGTRVTFAAAICVSVVTLILVLRRCIDRAPVAPIGLTGLSSDARGFALGAATVLASGAVVGGALSLLGWLRWAEFDAASLLSFLVANTVVALLFEAIPEEVAIRGYALSALRSSFRPFAAAALGIVAFLLVPIIALSVGWGLSLTHGGSAFVLAPDGQDAISYYVMLAAFGLMLTYARDATITATVWTCIGAHIAWLTVNRIVLGGAAGIELELRAGAEMVFFTIYTSVAVIAFSLYAARARAREATAAGART